MSSAYIVIAHGSRNQKGNEAFFEFIETFRKSYPKRHVEPAFLELAKPLIPEAIEAAVKKGADQIFVVPMMLFPGRHVKEHIPQYIEEAKARHPEVDFHYAGPLSDHPMLIDLVEEKAKGITPKRKSGRR